MEDGTATSGGGSDDRHDTSQRRKTVSGVSRHDHEEYTDQDTATEAMKLPWLSSTTSAPSWPAKGHKRSISGSILQKLNFMRNVGSDEGRPPSRDKEPPKSPKSFKSRRSMDDDTPITSPTSPRAENLMSFALQPVKGRKRKGSLRKTALLGGRRFMSEGQERKNSLSAKSPLSQLSAQAIAHQQEPPSMPTMSSMASEGDLYPVNPADSTNGLRPLPAPRRRFSYENAHTPPSSSNSSWSEPAAVTAARLSLVTEHKALQGTQTAGSSTNELMSPLDLKSPVSQASYASTTDDDDILTFDRPTANSLAAQTGISLQKPHSSAATGYYPGASEASLPRRRTSPSHHKPRSPLSHTISSSSLYPPEPPPHDYTETEYWGWVILFVTWLTFTVGMGSCLDLWSWAWDVGETPYAPPELEDDPTLPIVGYYPALIVLTGVVAWCWITVAWVGMKYFRHAKIEV